VTMWTAQRIGALRRRRLQLSLAESWAQHGCRRADDAVRSAALYLDAGAQPPWAMAVRAARRAVRRGEYPLAERLARAALAADDGAAPDGGAAATGSLATALGGQGRAEEAETVLAGTGPDQPTLQLVRAMNLRWGQSDRDTSRRMVEDLLNRAEDRVQVAARLTLAAFDLYDGRLAEALARVEDLVDVLPPNEPGIYLAFAVTIAALTALGRDDEAVERARQAHRLLDAEPDRGRSLPPTLERHHLLAAVVRAYLNHGELDLAEAVAQEHYDITGRSVHHLAAATWATMLGEIALLRGQLRTAVHLCEEGTAAARLSEAGGLVGREVRLLAARNHARALASVGRPCDGARLVADDDRHDLTLIELWTSDVDAALALADEHPVRAVELALGAAATARRLQAHGSYLTAVHQAVRCGGEGELPTGPLDGITVQGPLRRAQARHVQAAADSDAAGLEDAARQYAHLGLHPFAAEAFAAAARLYQSHGQRAQAVHALAQARASASRCDGLPRQPGALPDVADELTPRQRQIAVLAARGMASKLIARHLVLSVRTVDNLLGQVYRRLGIDNRRELAKILHESADDRRRGFARP
jgi:DNA-binding NarL/FixJ family response regulator